MVGDGGTSVGVGAGTDVLVVTGSGTSVQEVNNLLRQYAQMRKMFKNVGKGGMLQRRAMGMLGGMRGR